MMSKLKDGRIPPYTVCPYKAQCSIAKVGLCKHTGTTHAVSFSCATARGYELIQLGVRK